MCPSVVVTVMRLPSLASDVMILILIKVEVIGTNIKVILLVSVGGQLHLWEWLGDLWVHAQSLYGLLPVVWQT